MKDSLERLQLDYIDVLQCHRFDYETPIEETMQALHDVVQNGSVRYIGMSSCWAWQFQLMQRESLQRSSQKVYLPRSSPNPSYHALEPVLSLR